MEQFAGLASQICTSPNCAGVPPPAIEEVAVFAEGEERSALGFAGEALEECAAVGFVQQHFAIAGDGDGASVGRPAKGGDDGRLQVDDRSGADCARVANRPSRRRGIQARSRSACSLSGSPAERHAGLRHAGDVANDETLVRLPGDESGPRFPPFWNASRRREVEAGGQRGRLVAALAMLLQNRSHVTSKAGRRR